MSSVDEGWIDADDYDGYIPFETPEENEKRLAALRARKEAGEFIGLCPVCGAHVVEKEKGFFCDNKECHFALWKNNRFFEAIGKEMTREVADELLNCGTVKLDGCKSRRTGNSFNCYIDMTVDEEQRPHFEIRFPQRKKKEGE